MTDGDNWQQVESYRERVENAADMSDADADAISEFSEELELMQSEFSDARHEKLLGHVVRLAENVGGLADALDDRDAARTILRYINDTYDNEEYNRDNRIAVRVFGRVLAGEDNDPPPSIDWISSTYSETYDPSPLPENMLRWEEDIRPMIDACHNDRDRAYIAMAWDLGARPSELDDLTVGNVTDHRYGLKVTIENGKTGTRSPLIVPAVPFVNRWLSTHPAKNDDEAPLWSKLNAPEKISDRMQRKLLRKAANRAGVDRPVTRRNFRKSSASYLASENLNQAYIEDHHGWVSGSKIASRYVAVFGKETDREIARVHDVDVSEDESDPIGPVDCVRCHRETPRDEPKCMWCGMVLSHGAAERIKNKQREVRREVLEIVKEHPELLDRVDELERLIELADANPEMTIDTVDALGVN